MTSSIAAPPSHAIPLAETISLLHLLHTVPSPPIRNPIPNLSTDKNEYTLSFSQEKTLVSTLAFLSNLQDGPEHIPAVCLREDPSARGLNVLVAVNKEKSNDGNGVLNSLKVGFEGIFGLLSRMGASPLTTEDEIFTDIINMCSNRILCRLRLHPNSRHAARQPFTTLLQDAINALHWLEKHTTQKTSLLQLSQKFTEKAREVIKLLEAWSKYRKPARLKNVVDGFARLSKIGDLKPLFATIRNTQMDPLLRKSLCKTISKVSRYREAARFLHRTARKVPITRNMKIILVNLPLQAFQKPALNSPYPPNLSSTLARLTTPSKKTQPPLDPTELSHLLHLPESRTTTLFAEQTLKTLSSAKIHAEVQLVYFCSLQGKRSKSEELQLNLPPRVICSTKEACFLCDAFLRAYGLYTPRCHGRLYPAWRLPCSGVLGRDSRLEVVEREFGARLEGVLRGTLGVLEQRRRKTDYPFPSESTLLTIPLSMSTVVLGSQVLVEGEGEEDDEEEEKEERNDLDPSTSSTPSPPASSDIKTPRPTSAEVIYDAKLRPTPDTVSDIPSPYQEQAVDSNLSPTSPPYPPSPPTPTPILHQRHPLHSQSITTRQHYKSPLYNAGGHLEIQIEYLPAPARRPSHEDGSAPAAVSERPSEHSDGEIRFSLEYVGAEVVERLLSGNRGEKPVLVEDVEDLDVERECTLDEGGGIYIGARGVVVRVCFTTGSD